MSDVEDHAADPVHASRADGVTRTIDSDGWMRFHSTQPCPQRVAGDGICGKAPQPRSVYCPEDTAARGGARWVDGPYHGGCTRMWDSGWVDAPVRS